jgi:hypothetical protein
LGNLIKTCNEAILVLDKLEEQRNLSIHKSNFRLIIKDQVKKLLRYKNEYWRQRYTIRWVQLGDEPTRFFHAAATEKYRKMLFPYYRMRKGETSQPIKRKLNPFGTPSRPEWGLQKTPKLALSWITSIFLPSIWIA